MSSLDIQRAVVAKLKADSAVTALINQRVYDKPPANPTFPYVTLGPDQVVPDRADCYDGSTITFQVDAWSQAVGYPETKAISQAVRNALHEAELSLVDSRLIDLALIESRTMRDPDGLISHAALTFRALTEPV